MSLLLPSKFQGGCVSKITDIVALNVEARQVLLEDGTILAVRQFVDDTNHEVDTYDEAHSIVVVDHRSKPYTVAKIPVEALDFAGPLN